MRGGGYAFAGAEALQRTGRPGGVQMCSGRGARRGASAGWRWWRGGEAEQSTKSVKAYFRMSLFEFFDCSASTFFDSLVNFFQDDTAWLPRKLLGQRRLGGREVPEIGHFWWAYFPGKQ